MITVFLMKKKVMVSECGMFPRSLFFFTLSVSLARGHWCPVSRRVVPVSGMCPLLYYDHCVMYSERGKCENKMVSFLSSDCSYTVSPLSVAMSCCAFGWFINYE